MSIRRKTVSIWSYISSHVIEFTNPFFQKDQEYSNLAMSSSSVSRNLILPMTDYISISLFREHFFKWNVEHMSQFDPAIGFPLTQMEKAMMKVMDLYTENSELK